MTRYTGTADFKDTDDLYDDVQSAAQVVVDGQDLVVTLNDRFDGTPYTSEVRLQEVNGVYTGDGITTFAGAAKPDPIKVSLRRTDLTDREMELVGNWFENEVRYSVVFQVTKAATS